MKDRKSTGVKKCRGSAKREVDMLLLAVRHADASGGYIMENQHEEKMMRDTHVRKRGSKAATEEQSDKWRKTTI